MTNNDIIRRLRYTFNLNDSEVIKIFALAGYTATREQISNWLKKDDDPRFKDIIDVEISINFWDVIENFLIMMSTLTWPSSFKSHGAPRNVT